jgi:hypothetical protein
MKYTTSQEIREAAAGRRLRTWPGEKLTAVQVDALLGNMPGDLITGEGIRTRIIESLNDIHAIEDKPEPPKPTRLPIDRPVRIEDVEVGDVLRYCGVVDDHESWPEIGAEVVVGGTTRDGRSLFYSCTTKGGSVVKSQFAPDYCVAQGFSFVRRPFKAGEAVRYKADATKSLGWDGALLVEVNEVDRPTGYGIAVINHKGVHGSISAIDLERIL